VSFTPQAFGFKSTLQALRRRCSEQFTSCHGRSTKGKVFFCRKHLYSWSCSLHAMYTIHTTGAFFHLRLQITKRSLLPWLVTT